MAKKRTAASRETITVSDKKPPKAKLTKLARLEVLLRRPEGATIEQLTKALAWQAHSVRGAIAGALKKKGYAVTSEIGKDEQRFYRIA
jgi:Protein of unknown function (DUF3489)